MIERPAFICCCSLSAHRRRSPEMLPLRHYYLHHNSPQKYKVKQALFICHIIKIAAVLPMPGLIYKTCCYRIPIQVVEFLILPSFYYVCGKVNPLFSIILYFVFMLFIVEAKQIEFIYSTHCFSDGRQQVGRAAPNANHPTYNSISNTLHWIPDALIHASFQRLRVTLLKEYSTQSSK